MNHLSLPDHILALLHFPVDIHGSRLGIEAWLHPPESVLWRVKNPGILGRCGEEQRAV